MKLLLIITSPLWVGPVALYVVCALIVTGGQIAREDYWLRDPEEVQGA